MELLQGMCGRMLALEDSVGAVNTRLQRIEEGQQAILAMLERMHGGLPAG